MKKILIVDDHADLRHLLAITLGKEYDIIQADDGVTALEAVRASRPQMVLLDVMMPGEMDGLQVLSCIKTDPALKNSLVVMVTARGQKTDIELGRSLGADIYITKPFSPLSLMSWIRTQLQ
jgi:DNA-binding response OmpR family regulator